MRRAQLSVAVGGAMLLAGCATLGGNVKGDFQCSAPGGTCAPTSTIDDQAISGMTSDASVKSYPGAGSMGQDPINQYPVTPPSPTSLKVVLPAQQDRAGHWRNQSVVYVDGAAPLQAANGAAAAAPRLSLSDLAAGAPELAMFDSAPPVTTADIRRKVEATLATAPSASAVRPARTPAIVLPGQGTQKLAPIAAAATPAMVASAKSDVAAKVVTGPGLPVAETEDDH